MIKNKIKLKIENFFDKKETRKNFNFAFCMWLWVGIDYL